MYLFFSAFKIHISPDTKKLLDSFGSFTFQSRGFITVKVGNYYKVMQWHDAQSIFASHYAVNAASLLQGKGEMFTYWLVDGRRQSP